MSMLEGSDPQEPSVLQQQQQPPIIVNVPQPQEPRPQIPDGLLTREEAEKWVERIRQEEKDKLYETLEGQRSQLEILNQEREERLAAEEAQREAAEAEQRRIEAESQSQMERFEQAQREFEERLVAMQDERDRERALREQEARFAQLLDHKSRRLAEVGDQIDPRFLDYIAGNSPDEIDLSIQKAIENTNAIAAEFQELQQGVRRQMTMPVSGQPSVDPSQMTAQERQLTADDIRNMDPKDYAAMRSQLLQAGSELVRERGLYGAP